MEQLTGLRLHALVSRGRTQGGPYRRSVPVHVEVGFIDGGHLHQGRKRLQHAVDLCILLYVSAKRSGMAGRRKWPAGKVCSPCAAAGPSGRRYWRAA